MDLPSANPEEVSDDIVDLLGCKKSEIIHASAKTGQGIEEILDAENLKLEKELREISEERKAAKSKKRKYELYRKCRRRLKDLTRNWNETKDIEEEERRAKSVKEAAMKERLKYALNQKQRKVDDEETSGIRTLNITQKAVGLQPDANLFVAAVTADLGCDNGPSVPSPARFGHRMKNFEITKPQPKLRGRYESEDEFPAMDRAVQPIRDEMWSGTRPCGQ